jgi:hypothetical protein
VNYVSSNYSEIFPGRRSRTGANRRTVAFDESAIEYFDRIVFAGSTIGRPARLAIDDYCKGCKADGIWDLQLDIGPLCGDNLTAALIKLKKLSTNYVYTNNNFVAGDYSQATGLTGNGSSKYLNADFVCSTVLTVNNTGMAVYDRTTASATVNLHGATVNGNSTRQFYLHIDNNIYAVQYDDSVFVGGGAISGAVGFISSARDSTAGVSTRIHRNGVLMGTQASSSGTLPNFDFYWFARNLSNVAQNWSAHTCSFLGITTTMTSAQSTSLYARVQALQAALGRNV